MYRSGGLGVNSKYIYLSVVVAVRHVGESWTRRSKRIATLGHIDDIIIYDITTLHTMAEMDKIFQIYLQFIAHLFVDLGETFPGMCMIISINSGYNHYYRRVFSIIEIFTSGGVPNLMRYSHH